VLSQDRQLTTDSALSCAQPHGINCWPSAGQPNPGRGFTYRRGKSVQTTGATSVRKRERSKGHYLRTANELYVASSVDQSTVQIKIR
jgi:hypothetical protein